jgi:PAS domain S-box-containing protein
LHTWLPEPLVDIEQQVLASGHWDGELVHMRRDGEQITVASRWALQRDANGQPLGVLQINTDVSAQKRAQAQAAYHAHLLAHVSDMVGATDAEGHITAWNGAAESTMGLKAEQVLGKLYTEVIRAECVGTDLVTALATLHKNGSWRGDVSLCKDDGSVILSEVRVLALNDEHGNAGYVAVVRDVTDRRLTEDALRESEARFRAIFERAGTGMAIVSLDGSILQSNEALQRMLWRSDAELQGVIVQDLVHAEDWAAYRGLTAQLLAGQRDAFQVEERYYRKDGEIVWGSATISLVRDPAGQPWFAIAMSEDITARKQAEQALAEHDRRLRLLHEIDRAILAARSPEQIAETALRPFCEVAGSLVASVILFDSDARSLTVLAVDGQAVPLAAPGSRYPVQDTEWLAAALKGEIAVVEDVAAFADFRRVAPALLAAGIRSAVFVPLVVETQVIGLLATGWADGGRPAADLLDFAGQVADSLAVTLQNARLFEQVQVGREQAQQFSRQLVAALEDERRTIARELHDEAGQALTALRLGLGLLQREAGKSRPDLSRIDDLQTLTDGVMDDLHRLALHLRPVALDRFGLVPALEQFIDTFKRQSNLEVSLAIVGLDPDRRMPADVETTLYRVVQESLTNTARHAQATRAGVIIERRHDRILAIVEDNGQGFDVAQMLHCGRLGLLGMRERAEIIGGKVTIESAPGKGATVFVDLPCDFEPPQGARSSPGRSGSA